MSDVELRALERAVRQGEPVPDAKLLAAWLRAHGDEEAKRTPMPGDMLARGRMRRLVVHFGAVVWGQVLDGGSSCLSGQEYVLHVVGPTANWIGDGGEIAHWTAHWIRDGVLPQEAQAIEALRDRAAQALRFSDLRWLMTGDPFRGHLRGSWRKWAKKASVERFGCPRCLGAGYRYTFNSGVSPTGFMFHGDAGQRTGWRVLPDDGALLRLADPSVEWNASDPCPDCCGTGWGFSPTHRAEVHAAVQAEASGGWLPKFGESIPWQFRCGGYPRAPLPQYQRVALHCVCPRTEPIPPGRTCDACGFPAEGQRTGTLRASWGAQGLKGLEVVEHGGKVQW